MTLSPLTPRPIRTASASVAELIDAQEAAARQGAWRPGTGETEILINGRRLLWCWQPSSGDKRYLDLDTDLLLSDEEMDALFR